MAPLTNTTTRTIAGLVTDVSGTIDSRPPLLLLHGLTFDRTMWRPALAELEAIDPGRRAYAIDLPGHGESPDAASYDLEATVRDLRAFGVAEGLTAPMLVGHSASAAHAAIYAARFRTSGIIEVEGGFVVEPFQEVLKVLEPQLRGPGFGAAWARISAGAFRLGEVSDDVRSFVEATSRPRPEVMLSSWRDLFELSTAELASWIADEGAAGIRAAGVPVVSVVGAEPSPAEVAWLRANLPEARTLVWAHSGHFPHLAHPARFARLLAETASWSAGRSASAAA